MQTIEPCEVRRGAAEPSDYEKERGKPMPNITHGAVQANITGCFYAQVKGRFRVVTEMTLEFEDGMIFTPDLSVLPKRDLDWGGEPVRCKEVPLLVVEIISPTQGYLEIHQKRQAYFAHGVGSVWIVEPDLQAVAVYRPGEARPQLVQQGEVKDLTTGLTAQLEDIFA